MQIDLYASIYGKYFIRSLILKKLAIDNKIKKLNDYLFRSLILNKLFTKNDCLLTNKLFINVSGYNYNLPLWRRTVQSTEGKWSNNNFHNNNNKNCFHFCFLNNLFQQMLIKKSNNNFYNNNIKSNNNLCNNNNKNWIRFCVLNNVFKQTIKMNNNKSNKHF